MKRLAERLDLDEGFLWILATALSLVVVIGGALVWETYQVSRQNDRGPASQSGFTDYLRHR